jgi:hypothetical protein
MNTINQMLITLVIILMASTAFGATLTTTVWDQKQIDPGYTLADTTTVQTMLVLGWLDVNYMHAAGSDEPFEVDAEISWSLYKDGAWEFKPYFGLFALNGEKFSTARELGLTTNYAIRDNLTASIYGAKVWGQISEGGIFAKFCLSDQYVYGNFGCGWKSLLAYNGNYFLDDSGWSHRQLQGWISYDATSWLTIKFDAGHQHALMEQFSHESWYGLTVDITSFDLPTF